MWLTFHSVISTKKFIEYWCLHACFTFATFGAYFLKKLNIKNRGIEEKIIIPNWIFLSFFFPTVRNYLDHLAEEVNDKLQESGQVTISELCKTYDLPGNFLTQVILKILWHVFLKKECQKKLGGTGNRCSNSSVNFLLQRFDLI